jgi:hypothetical protein
LSFASELSSSCPNFWSALTGNLLRSSISSDRTPLCHLPSPKDFELHFHLKLGQSEDLGWPIRSAFVSGSSEMLVQNWFFSQFWLLRHTLDFAPSVSFLLAFLAGSPEQSPSPVLNDTHVLFSKSSVQIFNFSVSLT